MEELVAQTLEFLNRRGSASGLLSALEDLAWQLNDLVQHVSGRLAVSELTGEGRPEVVLGVTMPFLFLENPYSQSAALFVFACQGGRFQLAHEAIVQVSYWPLEIEGVVDMDRSGISEIVYSYLPGQGARGYGTLAVAVMEWDGARFVSRIDPRAWAYPSGIREGEASGDEVLWGDHLPPDRATGVFWGDGVPAGEEVRILDIDGDGMLELLLKNGYAGQYMAEGAKRVRTDILTWQGGYLQYAYSEHPPAEFRFQAVQDGDDATRFGFLAKALAFYQEAIFNPDLRGWSQGQLWPDSIYGGEFVPEPVPTPDPNERPRLEAYSRYRIMLLHAAQGNRDAALTTYETLLAMFPDGRAGHPYADLATAFWESFGQTEDVSAACDQATAYAASHEAEVLQPLGADFYGADADFIRLEDVCPFGD